jgi:hypothetical protein
MARGRVIVNSDLWEREQVGLLLWREMDQLRVQKVGSTVFVEGEWRTLALVAYTLGVVSDS